MSPVSVIIPSFNHAAYVPAAVESVLRQSHAELELIVVDDGSTDDSLAYLRSVRDPRVRLVEQENAGAHAAINRGLALARGETLAILNSDDLFHPERLRICVEALAASSCDLVATWIEVIDAQGALLGVKQGWANMPPWPMKHTGEAVGALDSFSTNLLLANFVSTTSNVVFTRRLYHRIGGMRNLRFAHDWDFLLRAAHEFRCELVHQALLGYRVHGANTISSNRAWMLFEICWVLATALRRAGHRLFGGGTEGAIAAARFLGDNVNLQGNDKLVWMIDQFLTARANAGDPRAEETLLDDKALREAFVAYAVV